MLDLHPTSALSTSRRNTLRSLDVNAAGDAVGDRSARSARSTLQKAMAQTLPWLLGLALISSALPSASAQGGGEAKELRWVTLGPQGTPWWRAFSGLSGSLSKETQGKAKLKLSALGVNGDEAALVRKLREGSVDGATLTAVGLAKLVPEALILQAPGLIDDEKKLDRAQEVLRKELEAAFDRAGFRVLGFYHAGSARFFVRKGLDQAPAKPEDLKNFKVATLADDRLFASFLDTVGAQKRVRLPIAQVRSALGSGAVDLAPASALAALYLGWHSEVGGISKESNSLLISATVVRKAAFDKLNAEEQKALVQNAERAHQWLREALRKRDEQSYAEFVKAGAKPFSLTPQRKAWEEASKKARTKLAQAKVFPKAWLDRLESELKP